MENEKKHLVLVVERTYALAPYWANIVETYLRKLIMAFCGNQNTDAAGPNVALGLVEFSEIKSGLLQWSGRTNDVDSFFTWLLAIQFSGGGFCDVEIAEGLASALKHLPSPNESQTRKNVGIQRHCILVAASNPPNKCVTESNFCLSDAERMATSFPQSLVSLSVICPKQLPKLKSIYNAGKRNHLAADYTIDIVENPHYLVLIAESFIEACSDFSQSGITILPSNPSRNDDLQNLKLAVSGSTNKSILNKLSQARQMNLAAIPRGMSTGVGGNSLDMLISNMISEGTISSIAVILSVKSTGQSSNASMAASTKLPGMAQMAHHTAHGSLISATPSISERSSLDMSQPPGIQGYARMAQSVPVVTQGNFQSPQLVKSGTSTNQNMMEGVVQAGMPATGTMKPPSRISQQVQTASALQALHSPYVKLWEGDLFFLEKGEPVFITRLQGSRGSTDFELLAEDWPPTMLIKNVVSQDLVISEQSMKKQDILVFQAHSLHGLFVKLKELNLCAVVWLPSQTLLLAVSDIQSQLIGMLFPKGTLVFESENSE